MLKLWSILHKEILLLFRDIPGLIILFLMPVLLIFVVTLAQEKALEDQHSKTPVLFVDKAGTPFAARLSANLDSSGFFHIVSQFNRIPLSASKADSLIGSGEYRFGIIVASHDTAIRILVDPALRESYKASVVNSLMYIIKGTQAKEVMNEVLDGMAGNMKPLVESMVAQKMQNLPPVSETYAMKERSAIQPNVIQNNVPGFILFAMFFIVIPLAGSLITEKNEGSFQRLRSLPVKMSVILGGKVILYLGVCLLQFILMMIIGMWVFPTFCSMPGLAIGHQYPAIAVATVAASLAAIGFGIIIGAAASTHNQAALFGSVMVVLLGIVSGTFFPVYLMPEAIRFISHLSPVRWGIDSYLDLFIRDGDILSILPNTISLLLFFGLAMIASIVIFAKRK